MSAQTNPIQSHKLALFHKDGLVDIVLGLGFVFAGAALWAELTFMTGIWVAVFLPLWISARKSITAQRILPAELEALPSGRRNLLTVTFTGLLILGIIAGLMFYLGIGTFPRLGDFLENYLVLAIGALLTFVLTILAAGLKTVRLAMYAIANAAIFISAYLLGWPFWISMVAVGVVLAVGGMSVLARFIREHPETR